MFLQMKEVSGVDNLRNYPAENVKELEQVLLSGVSAVPDAKRKDFYDLSNHERTFFVQISLVTGRVVLLATWLRGKRAVAHAGCSVDGEDRSIKLR
jgi:hypothetical protein